MFSVCKRHFKEANHRRAAPLHASSPPCCGRLHLGKLFKEDQAFRWRLVPSIGPCPHPRRFGRSVPKRFDVTRIQQKKFGPWAPSIRPTRPGAYRITVVASAARGWPGPADRGAGPAKSKSAAQTVVGSSQTASTPHLPRSANRAVSFRPNREKGRARGRGQKTEKVEKPGRRHDRRDAPASRSGVARARAGKQPET